MDSLGRVWDGFEWVVPKAEVVASAAPSGLHEPLLSRRWGLAATAFSERQAAQRRLVSLQRELQQQRSQLAKASEQERKREEASELRRERDARREMLAELAKVKPMEDEEVQEMSNRLNGALIASTENGAEHTEADWRRHCHRAFHRHSDDAGTMSFDAFCTMLRSVLKMKPRTAKAIENAQAVMRKLWRAIDDDGDGGMKGHLSAREFVGFMKLGRPEVTASGTDAGDHGWRARLAARNRASADAVRESLREQQAMRMPDEQVKAECVRHMEGVDTATDAQQRELSRQLNARMESSGFGCSWYAAFKRMDTDIDGRISWLEFASMVKHVLGIAPDQPVGVPHPPQQRTSAELSASQTVARVRSVWRSIDPALSGFMTVSEFAQFMKLGAHNHQPATSLPQLGSQRSRVSADLDHTLAQRQAVRAMEHERTALTEEADELERTLAALRRDVERQKYLRRHGDGAKTERTSSQWRRGAPPPERSYYMPSEEQVLEQRMQATYRRVSDRYRLPAVTYRGPPRRARPGL